MCCVCLSITRLFVRCSEPDIPQTNDVCPPNFESIDTDKNGKISASEWGAVFNTTRAEPISKEPQWVFPNGANTADTNNDGELSQQEYETYQPVVLPGDALPAKPDKCRPAKPDYMTQAVYDKEFPRYHSSSGCSSHYRASLDSIRLLSTVSVVGSSLFFADSLEDTEIHPP